MTTQDPNRWTGGTLHSVFVLDNNEDAPQFWGGDTNVFVGGPVVPVLGAVHPEVREAGEGDDPSPAILITPKA